MNSLQAVFWDYPEFTDQDTIRQYIEEAGDPRMRRWLLQRFLEHGRAVDTLRLFPLKMLVQEFPGLKLRPYTYKSGSEF